jgi:hypothetical protein
MAEGASAVEHRGSHMVKNAVASLDIGGERRRISTEGTER